MVLVKHTSPEFNQAFMSTVKALNHIRGRRTKYPMLQGENDRKNFDAGQVASVLLLTVIQQ